MIVNPRTQTHTNGEKDTHTHKWRKRQVRRKCVQMTCLPLFLPIFATQIKWRIEKQTDKIRQDEMKEVQGIEQKDKDTEIQRYRNTERYRKAER